MGTLSPVAPELVEQVLPGHKYALPSLVMREKEFSRQDE